MELIYCIYTDNKTKFEVLELEKKIETDNLVTFEYREELGSGQVHKELLDEMHALKNDRGTAIFTSDKSNIKKHIKLISRKSLNVINEKELELANYKINISDTLKQFNIKGF